MGQLRQGSGVNRSLRAVDGGFEFFDLQFTAAAEAADNIDLTVQLIERMSTSRKVQQAVHAWLYISDVAAPGAGYQALGTAITSSTILTGAEVHSLSSSQVKKLVAFDITGLLVVRLNYTAAGTRYLNLLMPDGRVLQSPALTWV